MQIWSWRTLRVVALVLSVLLLIVQVTAVAINWRSYQYDFRTYYVGPKLVEAGENPYSIEAHFRFAERTGLEPKNLSFVYPPYMLAVFTPLSWLPYPAAYGLWLVVQVLALCVVVFVASQRLEVDLVWLAVLLAVGLNGAAAYCLRAGQLELIITAITLLSASFIRQARPIIPAILLTLIALPKLWNAPMIGLLLWHPNWRRFLMVAIGIAALIGILLLDDLMEPVYAERFFNRLHSLSQLDGLPAGPIHSNLRNFLKTIGSSLGVDVHLVLASWILASLAIIALTVSSCLRLLRKGDAYFAHAVFLSMLGLSLILPRFLIYQWTFVVPAAAFFFPRIESRFLKVALLVIALTPTLYIDRYLFGLDLPQRIENIFMVPWVFTNVIVGFTLWLVALRLR